MSRFLTPCFVRVENPAERKELIEWLKSIDRQRVPHSKRDRAPIFTAYANGRYEQNNSHHHWPTQAVANGFIDCGTNVELFKALAAMNDNNDREQWFIDRVGGDDEYDPQGDYGWYLCKDDKLRCAVDCYSKATAAEIIKHFSNNK